MRPSDDERLAALVARRNRTDTQIRRPRAKTDKLAPAQDARRKIVAGALALEHTIKNLRARMSGSYSRICCQAPSLPRMAKTSQTAILLARTNETSGFDT